MNPVTISHERLIIKSKERRIRARARALARARIALRCFTSEFCAQRSDFRGDSLFDAQSDRGAAFYRGGSVVELGVKAKQADLRFLALKALV